MNEAISAYQRITVSPEFQELERERSLARHDEATALYYAQEKGIGIGMEKGIGIGREEEREKWQGVVKSMEGVVADKDAEIARLRAELGRK